MAQPDVLQHPDRDEHVALPLHVAIVVVDELDLTHEPVAGRPRASEVELLARHVERLDRHAVVARHVKREGPPAAPGLDDRVAGPQPQFAAHEVELGPLCRGERHRRVSEVRARVHEVWIEPQLIEVVSEVVVVDVAAGVAQGVGRGQGGHDAGAP